MSDASTGQQRPFEEQRRVYELLSQETRHLILQTVLGHPDALPSLGELDHLIPKSTGAISDQVETLIDADVLAEYHHEPNEGHRDLPASFYGPTERGVEILAEYNYLRGLPVARSVYRNTRKTNRIERHESAPRPELPTAVRDALTYGDSGSLGELAAYVRRQNRDDPSLSAQLTLVERLVEEGVDPEHDGLTVAELAERIDRSTGHTRALLSQLVDAGVVERFTPSGPKTFVIDESDDEVVNGRVPEAAASNVSALIDHLDSEIYTTPAGAEAGILVADGAGETVRTVLADTFGVEPDEVADTLRSGDPVERVNTAVTAIEESHSVSARDDDGRILFVNAAHRYRLTERAVELIE